MEEMANIVTNGPLWPGDTVSHGGANECVRLGWAVRDADGDFVATDLGRRMLADWMAQP